MGEENLGIPTEFRGQSLYVEDPTKKPIPFSDIDQLFSDSGFEMVEKKDLKKDSI